MSKATLVHGMSRLACTIGLAVCAWISLATSARGSETDTPRYFYDATGRRAVQVSPDEVLVSVKASVASADGTRPAFLPERVVPDNLPAAADELEARLARRNLHVVRNADRQSLQSTPGVAYALPLLYRNGSSVPIYPSNRVVVALREGAAVDELRVIADSFGCDVERCRRGPNRFLVTVRDPSAVSPLTVANALHERTDLTAHAHPDFYLPKVAYSPPVIEDPYYLSHQWHLDGDEAKGAEPGTDINVEAAWDDAHGPAAEGLPSVRVAILDECVEKWHPDLFPNWAAGIDYDVDPPDDDPSPDGGQRHGTSCAGVAVAAGNEIGVRGAAPNCGLIGVKFFGASLSEMADSFYFCVDPDGNGDHADGAAILSNSWGFADGTLLPDDVVAGINAAATSGRNGLGCLVLFAAANNDHTINGVSALAQLETVMAIGGTNSNGEHTEFSDVGPELAIAAPTNDRGDDGVRLPWLDITTVDNTGESGYNGLPDLDYTNRFGGTSSATPLAAGVLALILSQDPAMTAAQVRAIAQHTAVRVDEPYGRFDGITGHSHRLGFGRVDAGAAVTAAHAGVRWPDRIKTLSANAASEGVSLTWATPANDYAASLLVRSGTPFAWMPVDGETYGVGDEVAPGVRVVYADASGGFLDEDATTGAFFYGVYPRSPENRYGFGAKGHVIHEPLTLFSDNGEIPDPGWTHGGPGDEWSRGTPTSATSIFGQSVVGSGPLAGLRGLRAIGGDNCWGTDLRSQYSVNADAYLQTPLINLAGVTVPVFLEYYDWCLLETFYDRCRVEVVDADGTIVGTLVEDSGGDYDWTHRVYDLTPYAGQAIRVRFRLLSDGLLQRDGWFLDDIRVVTAGIVPLPPVAEHGYVETSEDTWTHVLLQARDPNPGDVLEYVIRSLPEHGTLSDPFGDVIGDVPYTLLALGTVVTYTPEAGYQGPDGFTWHATDGALESNEARVALSVGTPVVAYAFPLDTNPGWLVEGQWAFGPPQGRDGDPSTAYTGLNVYGYNLAGAYSNLMPARHLTSMPLNCSGLSRITLRFVRWLGVESANWDSASVEVSTDGVSWHPVWTHAGDDLQETEWSVQTYGAGMVADGQPFVQFRWTLGPTDGDVTFSGWNLDDVEVLGIGRPADNNPPFAEPAAVSTAKETAVAITLAGRDAESDPLTYTVVALPTTGVLADPVGGVITETPYTLTDGARTVEYTPEDGFAGEDAFAFQVDDGELSSNVATVTVTVIDAADFPFEDTFEAGPPLSAHWSTRSTGTGRIVVNDNYDPDGAYHVTMDSSYAGSYSANELTLAVDLEGASFVRLEYDWKDFGEEADPLPDSWTGSTQGDGVAISADGITWHRIADLFDPDGQRGDAGDDEAAPLRSGFYQTVIIDLDRAASEAGMAYSNTFRIRFQQYDNQPIDSDGIAIDNVKLIQGTTDPLIATTALPDAFVDQAYGPVAMTAVGGDLPLTWSVLDDYGEEPLGENRFAAVGTGQGWIGGNEVFDYTLPFAFPFYGGMHTQVKVAIDGWINFGDYVGSTYNNSELLLSYNRRIAVLWDNLRTDQGGDIYVDESVPGQVTIRWDAVTHSGLHPCNFSATLHEDGRVEFHYGGGNTNLTPTIGVSAGDQVNYTLSAYDGAASLTDADSVEFDQSRLPPGLVLDDTGTLHGTPGTVRRYKPIFRVEDTSDRADTKMIPIRVIPELYGDYDRDGDTDLADYDWFAHCMETEEPSPQCLEVFDANGNGRIDLADFGAFQRAFEQGVL